MSLLRTIHHAIFTGDRNWAWRRRMAFLGCGVALYGVLHAILWETDHAWGAVVLTNCWAAFGATMITYAGLATADDHLKRKQEQPTT